MPLYVYTCVCVCVYVCVLHEESLKLQLVYLLCPELIRTCMRQSLQQ